MKSYTIDDLHQIIDDSLNTESFIQEPQELYAPIDYTLKQGGKRMRPMLVLLACDMFNGDITKAIKPALGLEIFHNFTLIHDDIMDNAPLRRGKKTVFKKWNTNIAILSGDAMFITAYQYMMHVEPTKLFDILTLFNTTAIEVCEGQQYDMNFETIPTISIDDYIKMIHLKTAVLVAASLKTGAIIGGADSVIANQLYNYGQNIGLAFQLKDDILDVFGDTSKFGKKTGSDISTNKKTYLYIKAFELANADQTKKLSEAFSQTDQTAKISEVTAMFTELNVKQHAENLINQYYDNAMKILNMINIPVEKKANLLTITNNLKSREI